MEEETLDQYIRRSEEERTRLIQEQTQVLVKNGALVEQLFALTAAQHTDPGEEALRLRDHKRFVFASAAIGGMLFMSENSHADPNALARRAWAIADAMIRNA